MLPTTGMCWRGEKPQNSRPKFKGAAKTQKRAWGQAVEAYKQTFQQKHKQITVTQLSDWAETKADGLYDWGCGGDEQKKLMSKEKNGNVVFFKHTNWNILTWKKNYIQTIWTWTWHVNLTLWTGLTTVQWWADCSSLVHYDTNTEKASSSICPPVLSWFIIINSQTKDSLNGRFVGLEVFFF